MKPDEIRKKAKGIAWSDADDISDLEDSIFKALLDVAKQAREEIVGEVIQILNDESDLRMDELVSLKNKVYSLESKPSTEAGKDGGI